MQKKLLLKKLLKSKINNNKDEFALIDEFIKEQKDFAKKQLEEFLASLFIFINQNYDLNKQELLALVNSKLETLDIKYNLINIEEIYLKTIALEDVGIGFAFNKTDFKTIENIKNSFVFAGDKYNKQTQDLIKNTIKEAFKGNITREQISLDLKEKFTGIIDKDEKYFELVADNIILQNQNISRVNQALKYDVKYFKVVAQIDSKTSEFCRCANGKIIQASSLKKQINNIINASSIQAKKEAAQWSNKPIYGKFPANIALPPYHARCRTMLVPVYLDEEIIDEFDRVVNPLSKEIDRKIINKKGHLKDTRYKNPNEMLEATIKNISKEGQHINNSNKRVVWGQNGCIAIIDQDGNCETCFKPSNGIIYYENTAITKYDSIQSKLKGIKKWLEKLHWKF